MMTEWHVTPDYIVNNWTDELLDLMIEKLAERKKREMGLSDNSVSADALAAQSRGLIKVVKK